MALDTYRQKRRFTVTSEPRGRTARTKGHQFVIQKHAARRLHYDLRLELDGVMKSWAVTRGPSYVPEEKRLAVEVEDHPVEYNTFEGTIPEGEYGGGTVMIWDRGTWSPVDDAHKGLKKGHLRFTLDGGKLKGEWHLIRLRPRAGEKRTNWLLIKAHDGAERSVKDPDILEAESRSAVTGRTIEEIAAGKGRKSVWHSNRPVADNVKAKAAASPTPKKAKSAAAKAAKATPSAKKTRAKKAPSKKTSTKTKSAKAKGRRPRGSAKLPDFLPPSLATLRAQAPSGDGWVHEVKFDGYRMQARIDQGQVKFLTRKGLDWNAKFPNVVAALAELPVDTALIDGEVVVENADNVSDFSMLQAALSDGERDAFRYYVFDLLHRDGVDLSKEPLLERKAALKALLDEAQIGDPLRYSEHFTEDGDIVWQQACKMSLEGIVSKRADAPYRSGRSDAFVKTKCHSAQEFVVGAYAPSTAMPRAIGGLAVGYYDGNRLVYAGRVGTGYTHATARELFKRLQPLKADKPPFDDLPREIRRRRDLQWVKPQTVIESHFRGWTADGMVRQAAFKGVRDDKPPGEIVRERPAGEAPAETPREAAAARRSPKKSSTPASPSNDAPRKAGSRSKPKSDDGSAVRFTNPDRVYWADAGVSKQDLGDFYRAIWPWMEPHLVGRPLSLLRCPDGTGGECFFQKHASAGLSDTKLRAVIDKKGRQVMAVEDLDGLLSLVQAGVLEVHVRGSTIEHLDLCDRIVFDIDPGEQVGWDGIVAAARDVRARLEAIDLASFVKVTGGKGVHVVLPVTPVDWEIVKTFVQAFAQAMAADAPERYVAKMTKSLRKGKVFIDYMRNSLEQTAVAAFSTRARADAPVSVPVTWEELPRLGSASQYTVLTLGKRLKSLKRDPWADIAKVKQSLPDLKSLRRRR